MTLVAVGAVAATVAGALFDLIRGASSLASSLAFAFWVAATVCLLLRFAAGTRLAWRRLDLPEGWVFVTAALFLTGAGAAIDALGS
ncbi:MAG TPA: hypothetical protein VII51_11455 [Gaiellaceae bacterium]